MEWSLIEITEEDKGILFNLMQLYTYELTFYEDETTNFTLLDSGLYSLDNYLESFLVEENRHAYILKCNDKLAGFVMQICTEKNINEIAEFFVINKYRRMGAGTFMANKMFELYGGKWEISTLTKNEKAQAFWRNVVSKASDGDFEENFTTDKSRYVFNFEN